MSDNEMINAIQKFVNEGLPSVDKNIQPWVKAHLIEPVKVKLANDPDGQSFGMYWLITDANGKEDSSKRVVFDERTNSFGLEMTLDTGIQWYMGSYGSFCDAVEGM